MEITASCFQYSVSNIFILKTKRYDVKNVCVLAVYHVVKNFDEGEGGGGNLTMQTSKLMGKILMD